MTLLELKTRLYATFEQYDEGKLTRDQAFKVLGDTIDDTYHVGFEEGLRHAEEDEIIFESDIAGLEFGEHGEVDFDEEEDGDDDIRF